MPMSKLTRRDFIHSGCAAGLVTLAPDFLDVAKAGINNPGSSNGGGGAGTLSARNVLNLNNFSFATNDYALINHVLPGTGITPNGYTSTNSWPSVLDANGWPNNAAASGQTFNLAFQIPDPSNFPGPYILDWFGNGQIDVHFFLNSTSGTITTSNLTNVTLNGGNTFSYLSTGGASQNSITLNFSTIGFSLAGPNTGVLSISATGGSGFFIKNVRLYRAADAADLAAGKIWRSAWKQPIVNLCPSAVRFMDLIGGVTGNTNCRFENRTLATNATYGCPDQAGENWTASPVYAFASGTNQYTTSSSPTTANPKTPTASMTHGEIATVPVTNAFSRTPSGSAALVTGVTNANPGVVTVNTPVGLAQLTWAAGVVTATIFENIRNHAGDVVQFVIAGATQTGYNGTFTCTFTSGTVFTYPLASNPGASPATGSPTYAGHGYNTGDIVSHYINPVQVSGTSNSTATILTGNTSGVFAGMTAFGAGIPSGTTVLSVVANTSILLSASSTLTASNVQIKFRVMNNLHEFPVKITVLSATTYSLQTVGSVNVDTTGFGTYHAPSGGAFTYAWTTLQVGSGNDRTPYPIAFIDGNTPGAFFGNFMGAGSTRTFYFDKQCSAQSDGAGNPIYGIWMFVANPGASFEGHRGDYPIEVCVALINELNAMSPAHTIGMWFNLPAWGLCALDPNYSTASDWALNALDVILNPSSSVRTGGYSALGYSGSTRLNTPNLVVEYSNETWNSNNVKGWLPQRSVQRWGGAIFGQNDYQDMQMLRQVQIVRTIKASSIPNLSQAKFVVGMWGAFGLPPSGGDGAGNYPKVFGGSVTAAPNQVGDWYTSDSLVTGGSWGRPIDNLDGICPATYFDPPDSYYDTTTGTGTFTDDSAMYNGTNNSGNGGGNYTGAANPSQAITNFVAKVVDSGNTGGGQSIYLQQNVLMPQYSSTLVAQAPSGKVVINYEGGADWAAGIGMQQTLAGFKITTIAQLAFVIGVLDSSQWATAQVNFFNAVNSIARCFMPSIFTWIGAQDGSGHQSQRWAYCSPDTYETIGGTPTEGAALTVNSPVWIAMGNRNQALPN